MDNRNQWLVFLTVAYFFIAFVVAGTGRYEDEVIEFYSSYLSALATSVVLVWIVINSINQKKQLDLQRVELELTRKVLNRTASSNFFQFVLSYIEKMDNVLSSIEKNIIIILEKRGGIPQKNAQSIKDIDNAFKLIRQCLQNDPGNMLRSEIQNYIEKSQKIKELVDLYEDNEKVLAEELINANYAQKLSEQFRIILKEI